MPTRTPVRGQNIENLGLRSIESQKMYRAADQKKIDNESTVMRIDSALKTGSKFSTMTDQKATFSRNNLCPSTETKMDVPRASSGLRHRTPNSVGPNSEVPARIARATPGPLL